MPRAGAKRFFCAEGYGPAPAFFSLSSFRRQTGTIAAVAIAFGQLRGCADRSRFRQPLHHSADSSGSRPDAFDATTGRNVLILFYFTTRAGLKTAS